MATPLADALAAYRDQLGPRQPPRDPTPAVGGGWSWCWSLTVLVLGVGGVLALQAGELPLPRAPPPRWPGPLDPAPTTGSTPTATPATTVGAPTLATPPASGWVVWESPVVRTWLPRIPAQARPTRPAPGSPAPRTGRWPRRRACTR